MRDDFEMQSMVKKRRDAELRVERERAKRMNQKLEELQERERVQAQHLKRQKNQTLASELSLQIHQQKQKTKFENAIARGLRNEALLGGPRRSECCALGKKTKCGGCKNAFPIGKLSRTPL